MDQIHRTIRRLAPAAVAVCLALAAAPAAGQGSGPGTVQGQVVGETGEPLASVSVVVRSAADSSVVAGELSNPTGRFRIAGLQPGRYLVTASLLGYSTFSRGNVEITAASPVVNLGTVTLAASAIALEGVTVEGERSQMVVAPDRTIYSTREMPVAAGGVATDVLRSVPELEVDIEGSVSLRGTSAQIYLNGRPAPMEGEGLQVFLEQFPADRIERIEVIANPSARFEAEGAGGIVNIVLKEDVDLGLSGSVFSNANTRGDMGGGGRLTFQRGRLTLFGGGFLRVSDRYTTSYDLRQNLLAEPVTLLEQDAWSDRGGLSGNVDLTTEWEFNDRSTAWLEGRVFRNGDQDEGLTAYTRMYEDEVVFERYRRAEEEESVRYSADLGGGFRHVFEPRRHELDLQFEYEGGEDTEESIVRTVFLTPSGDASEEPDELTLEDAGENETELTAEADYVRPWGEQGQIELGYQWRAADTQEDRLMEVFASPEATVPEETTVGGFGFREVFNSGYLTLARSTGDWAWQAGLRAEWATTDLELPGGEPAIGNEYFSIFPNGNLAYTIDEGREVRVSYSRRIRRPSPWVLSPINTSTDPLNRSVGNPDIEPQYTHSVSVETSFTEPWGTLRFSPYYRRTEGDWARIKTVDAAGVSTISWENLASNESYGTSVTASVRPIGGVGGYLSLSGDREVRDASNLALDYSGSSFRWSARGNLSARLMESLNLQGMFFYRPARDVPQGRISSSLMTHIGVRQQLLDNRLSINLMMTDPLDLHRQSFETRDPTHIQVGRSSWTMRSATLSVSYSFGRPPRDGRDRGNEPGQPEEPEPDIR